MNEWKSSNVWLRLRLGDLTLASFRLPMQVRQERLGSNPDPSSALRQDASQIPAGSQGLLIRGLPINASLPTLSKQGELLCYAPLQYQHCHVDLGLGWDAYTQRFSSKTRSTIQRKVRKFTEHGGGALEWKVYTRPTEMAEFLQHARQVSKQTYQERLLDVGIPGSEEFTREVQRLAEADRVRAFVLFDRQRPVSYLYCPAEQDALIYAYLGYEPSYASLSAGTVLQWLALEYLMNEARFKYFDFTEGQSEHKRLFATHQRQCANVYFLRDSLRNRLVVHAHKATNTCSAALGRALQRAGLKAKLKRWIRR
ncbi:GNAT family N-acetyltransferase [Paucibacter soli]|uniref:GNAT family N-acetyltransferase n=1 Tax=Paucibacter soli TaxID=3133433 RepID=UPI00309C7074